MEKESIRARHTRLMEAFHRVQRVNISSMSSMMEVSQGEFFALQIISRYQQIHPEREGIYVSKIAEKLRIAPSQISRMLKKLEERELIGRSVDTRDRRNTYVFLSENGKEVCRQVQNNMQVYFESVWKSMGEEQIDELIRLCNRLADCMESEVKKKAQEAGKKQESN